MRRTKKSSLSLSVNAIVVFVLAFAMLGVGLWFVNMIRENIGGSVGDVFDISNLKNPPTSDNPITISQNINLKRGGSIELEVGFYNVKPQQVTDATVGVKECVFNDEDGLSGFASAPVDESKLPSITSASANVEANTGTGFKIIMKDRGLTAGTTYVCKLVIYEKDNAYREGNGIYEEKSGTFFLTIGS